MVVRPFGKKSDTCTALSVLHILAEYFHFAAGYTLEAQSELNRGCLSRAVRTQESKDLAGRHIEAYFLQDFFRRSPESFPVFFLQIKKADRYFTHPTSLPSTF